MSANYITKVNSTPIAASEVVPNSPLATKLQTIAEGTFEVVQLTTGANPVPDVSNPSTSTIYLTKSSEAGLLDPYTEWIYAKQGTNPETYAWEIIGTTAMDLSKYKTKQSQYTATGLGTLKTITSLTQSPNGEISATASDIQSATTGQPGVVQLSGSIAATVSTENNRAASEKAVRDAIDALDASVSSAASGNVQVTVTEANGVITGVSVTDNSASSNHDHGNITNAGAITGNGAQIATGDSLVIVDSDSNSLINKTTITFDGSTTTQFLTKAGTWGTTPSANDGKLKVGINGVTPTSLFTANQSTDSELLFASGTTNGTIKVNNTEVAVAGLGSAAYTATSAYATAAQGQTADRAVQGVTVNEISVVDSSTKIAAIPLASTPSSVVQSETTGSYGVVQLTVDAI